MYMYDSVSQLQLQTHTNNDLSSPLSHSQCNTPDEQTHARVLQINKALLITQHRQPVIVITMTKILE